MSVVFNKRLCLVEDDPIMGESLHHRLGLEGLDCDWYRDGRSALDALRQRPYAALISDIRLPDLSGERLFDQLLEQKIPLPPTLFITGYGSIDQAVRLIRSGARDYITKPFDLDGLVDKLREISPNLFLDEEWQDVAPVLGTSVAMRRVQKMLQAVARHRVGLLLTGESGAGKEYAALFVHRCGDETECLPFVTVNCAAIPETLLEAELFGHEKGAYTGADRARRGVFERADGGTLFLDEIGEMSLAMQAKLLRVLQEGKFARVGGDKTVTVSVRVVCATNRDLRAMVEQGDFREDLYYRINVAHVHIPPLRQRADDVLWFARMFVRELAEKHSKAWTLSQAAEQYLLGQDWRGNVRQLRNTIERACVFASGRVLNPDDLAIDGDDLPAADPRDNSLELKIYLERCERLHILETLEAHQWAISATSRALGISRKNLWEKMRKYALHSGHAVE